jgi:clan AA aspartic protease (TIGR02281 family)
MTIPKEMPSPIEGNHKRICSSCGSEMKIKPKHSGKDAGAFFWVCVKYPECRSVEKCESSENLASNVLTDNIEKPANTYVKEAIAISLVVLFIFTIFNRGMIRNYLGIGQQAPPETIEVLDNKGLYAEHENQSSMDAMTSGKSGSTTDVIVIDNRVHVPVMISYQGKAVKLRLVVDTGATGITVSQAVAEKLGVKMENTVSGSITVADGSRVATAHITADSVTVGPKTIRNIELVIIPSVENEYTGLLGMSFLGEYPHILDIKAKTIKWM